MRLLIDTNILLDVLQKREPYIHDSALIWKLCETKRAEGCISALSIANIVYIMRKKLNADRTERTLNLLQLIFRVEDLKADDLIKAAEMKWDDFEDAIQDVLAQRIHANCIVTRNVQDFKKSRLPVFTPAEYLKKI